ncbi:MAG: HAMP domain-containing sensor histidine kinase [Deltaproteobacteria bacterium]|nr:HAMP domain-containing sensor histidine kinase [Deltaproteobacteria bacterium]
MRLSVTTKIFLGLALVVLTFGAVSLFAVVQLHRIGEDLEQVSQTYLPLAKVTAELEAAQKNRAREIQRLIEDERAPQVQTLMIKIARSQHPKNLQRLADALARCNEGLARASRPQEQRNLQAFADRLARLREAYVAYDAAAALLQGALTPEGEGAAANPGGVAVAASELRAAERRLGLGLRQLGRTVDLEVARQVARAEEQEDRAALAIMILSLIAVLVGLLVTLFVQRTLRPIRRLTDAARAVQEGHFDPKVDIDAQDEIGDLARAFNEMTEALASRDAALARQREALLRSERLATVGRMAAQVSHEIRNPLSSVGLNNELLGDEVREAHFESPERRAEVLALIQAITREVDRLTEITEDYLRFARLPRARRHLLDLREVVDATCSFSEEELRMAGAELSLELPEVPVELAADASQIRALLLNLLRNAREALGGRPGKIRVSVATGAEGALLRVDDDGPGVPAEQRESVFDPFVSTRENGTGLGLALCAQIVAEHQGRLHCAESPLGGARFEVFLPVLGEESEAAPGGTDQAPEAAAPRPEEMR